ncbi:unnamed protein product [Phaeothamnion confervicola]
MNIYSVLENLEKEVSDSKTLPWPLQEKTIVDRDRLLEMIEKTRRSLPDEIRQARWISRETERLAEESNSSSERLMLEARHKYEEILAQAEQIAQKLVSKEEIYKRAQVEAKRILSKSAQEHASRSQLEAEQYLKRLLAALETDLGKATAIVQKSRRNLSE